MNVFQSNILNELYQEFNLELAKFNEELSVQQQSNSVSTGLVLESED